MRWLSAMPPNDRGAVAVVVALLMVVLLGCAAISIDVGSMYAKDRQLQNGADAAALAIAQDCAWGLSTPSCVARIQTAQNMARWNTNNGMATVDSVTIPTGSAKVTVSVSADLPLSFAPALGVDSSTRRKSATATWGAPSVETALPLAFSKCAFDAQTNGGTPSGNTPVTIKFSKFDNTGCTGASGNAVPGGFGWLVSNGNCMSTFSTIDAHTASQTGKTSKKSGCDGSTMALHNQTVMLPLFDDAGGNGHNAWYHIYGFAAFYITGYFFGGNVGWNSPCGNPDQCISGYFTKFTDISGSTPTGGGSAGVAVVKLVQ